MSPINGLFTAGSASAALATVKRSEEKLSSSVALETGGEHASEDEQLSGLAKKLSAAAERAAERDSKLSRKELADLASKILDRLGGSSYYWAKDFYDSQLPDTEDQEWLERARQANDFSKGKGPNPFEGFSREQLSLIVHDESGAFTVNERRAARSVKTDLHNAWAQDMIRRMNAEHQQTGRSDNGLREILTYYNSLPPIEVAEYGNYEANIMMQLSMHEVEWPEFNTSLVDMLANEWGKEDLTQPDPAQATDEAEPGTEKS
ncbi:hypothetical protein F3J44_06520 [Pantoea sp. Tr-811]|uniref:hypothetical protein n=1 Tax=unclassified Pantoea TaxID=2630326 RepID=UPI00142445F0|nr:MULTISPECIES: hypothetical protein [unclassified Pantoea]NIE76387.1 hypothetical protein [Pantoea sp. Ap-967]NIF26038.1 hypothetical protein [Pantoea sp. Tr-811]